MRMEDPKDSRDRERSKISCQDVLELYSSKQAFHSGLNYGNKQAREATSQFSQSNLTS